MSLCRLQVIGNLGKDPEIKTTKKGERYATFSIASTDSWKDASTGEKRERTEWTNIKVLDSAKADIIERYVKKGDKLFVEAVKQTSEYLDENGEKRRTTDYVISRFSGYFEMLGGKRDGQREYSENDVEESGGKTRRSRSAEGGRANDLDEEIPFSPEFR